MELPHLESIVVLNIPYWGGGVEAWKIGQSENRSDIPYQRFKHKHSSNSI